MSHRLSDAERAFVTRRAQLGRHWRWAGPALLGLLLALVVWLAISNPLLVSPFHVVARLRADALAESTLVLMAGLLPVAVLTCLLLAFALLACIWDAMRHERRLIAIVTRLESHGSAAEPPTGQDGMS